MSFIGAALKAHKPFALEACIDFQGFDKLALEIACTLDKTQFDDVFLL